MGRRVERRQRRVRLLWTDVATCVLVVVLVVLVPRFDPAVLRNALVGAAIGVVLLVMDRLARRHEPGRPVSWWRAGMFVLLTAVLGVVLLGVLDVIL